jgi:hypothetical protein
MPFFNIKNGNIKAIKDQLVIGESDTNWLVERVMLNDDIFTERLLIIDQDKMRRTTNNYLLALDEKAELVLVCILDKTPGVKNIGSVCELAWSLRNLTYGDLEDMATEHFKNTGINVTDLVDLHSQHFDLKQPARRRRFNETQRVFILAPSFDQSAANAICWRRAETDISAYAFNIIETENSERLLIIQPEVKGGAISSVMSAAGNIPATIKRRLLRKDKV